MNENFLIPKVTAEVDFASNWRWRSKDGRHTYPKDMETSHLFYTLRMIWNHTMPLSARIQGCKHYEFGPTYTHQYMMVAIALIARELGKRKIASEHQKQLDHMITWLQRHHISHTGETICLS